MVVESESRAYILPISFVVVPDTRFALICEFSVPLAGMVRPGSICMLVIGRVESGYTSFASFTILALLDRFRLQSCRMRQNKNPRLSCTYYDMRLRPNAMKKPSPSIATSVVLSVVCLDPCENICVTVFTLAPKPTWSEFRPP